VGLREGRGGKQRPGQKDKEDSVHKSFTIGCA
jgi:hypothetical protein